MKVLNIVTLSVALLLVSPVVSAKKVSRSDLFESTLSVGYKTRDIGAGVSLDADWYFSDTIGVYGSVQRLSGDDKYNTDDMLERFEIDRPAEDVFPRVFSFDLTGVEYGFSVRHIFYHMIKLLFPFMQKWEPHL